MTIGAIHTLMGQIADCEASVGNRLTDAPTASMARARSGPRERYRAIAFFHQVMPSDEGKIAGEVFVALLRDESGE